MSRGRCPFCDIAEGAEGVHVVYEDPHAVVFMDRHPINPGHVLAVPRAHAESFYELDEGSFVELMRVVRRVALALQVTFRPRKVGMLAAGFDVPHAHIHVLPLHDYHDITSRAILEGRRAEPNDEELRQAAEHVRRGLLAGDGGAA